jgi:hypothetical protein
LSKRATTSEGQRELIALHLQALDNLVSKVIGRSLSRLF